MDFLRPSLLLCGNPRRTIEQFIGQSFPSAVCHWRSFGSSIGVLLQSPALLPWFPELILGPFCAAFLRAEGAQVD